MIAVASDHAGYNLKLAITRLLSDRRIEFIDMGCHSPDPVDYPVFAEKAARAVADGSCELGILCCGSGVGMSITANKIQGVRAVCCSEPYSARMSREHNDANVLCIGERVVGQGLAADILDAFLGGKFLGGRHLPRVEMITALENQKDQ
ncbi:MAG TPA: ribose 5-phosphate isomerase B [Terriglobales bacterium]|nr:ribose 5-phosphate isomerase B [Terriglobales bacterium]